MKRLYMDAASGGCTAVYVKDAEVIRAGTTLSSMPVRMKNREYRKWAEEYDIHFIFEDRIPKVDFYTVPQVDLMAVDSRGGYIGTVGQMTDLESGAPICYIDRDRKVWLIAPDGAGFLECAPVWRSRLKRYEGIVFYASREAAEAELMFITESFDQGSAALKGED